MQADNQVADRMRPRAAIVHEVIRKEGEEELARTPAALSFSGLAAGLSMGFSLVVLGLLRHGLPDAPWRPLIESFGYTIGFLIVVLGRQQLFTENTLTAVLPLLAAWDRASLVRLVRLWVVVLLANLVGAASFALLISITPTFQAYHEAFLAIAHEAAEGSPWDLFSRAVFAGWLIGLMVWLLPAAGSARFFVVLVITYVVGLAGFAHVIAGSLEIFYAMLAGEISLAAYLGGFLGPVLLGNIVGGSALVALINHAQVREEVGLPRVRRPGRNG
jgi:formate/nitrite transporter FocA (FNT family)